MSLLPALSALNADTQIWPLLAEVRASCYILLSASVQIVQPGIDGERLIKNHCPGTFTGEAGMIA